MSRASTSPAARRGGSGGLSELLEGKRICVCGGSGGVGKTTTSAAVALGMAARGAKVAVVTIDPAKRLANALGLQELENEPRRIEPERLAGALEMRGELWAMTLDPKRTFDELIDRIAPDPERAQEIKANRVYGELSTAVSGSQEFTAVAKLYELDRDGDFDLLVLDTPPSRNALDFLDAPGRLTSFLEGRALKAFLRPTGVGMRVLGRGAAPFLGAMRKVTGMDLLTDLSTFFSLLGDMTDDFGERAAQVEKLLRAPTTAFVLVTSAQQAAIEEAIWFRRTLSESGLPFAGVIVNRVHHDLLGEAEPDVRGALDKLTGLDHDLAQRVAANFAQYHLLARRDRRGVQRLRDELGDYPLLLVPYLDDDIHDVEGLLRLHRFLFASDQERERLIAGVVA
ncbi:MAG: AAA family ATPase [Actinomycetota bacterium]|nr:AAA family ATPase [Actinomycetota bacterium]